MPDRDGKTITATLCISYTYNGNSGTLSRDTTLDTAGKILASDITLSVVGTDVSNQPVVNITPSTSVQTVTPGLAYTGLSKVVVKSITVATPAYTGGTVSVSNMGITTTSDNVALTTVSGDGLRIIISAEGDVARSSVVYDGDVAGYVTANDGDTVLASSSDSGQSLGSKTIYVSGVTVPSNRIFTVINSGTLNVNGGNTDKGVQIIGHTAIVDTYTVTSSSGDLLVPTYSGTSLTYPSPGIFSDSASTTTMTITGNVTEINGLTVKDSNAVTGSGTTPGADYFYMPKISGSKILSNGPKVTTSTLTPSSGTSGDVWLQIIQGA